jgi:hypothetical protein
MQEAVHMERRRKTFSCVCVGLCVCVWFVCVCVCVCVCVLVCVFFCGDGDGVVGLSGHAGGGPTWKGREKKTIKSTIYPPPPKKKTHTKTRAFSSGAKISLSASAVMSRGSSHSGAAFSRCVLCGVCFVFVCFVCKGGYVCAYVCVCGGGVSVGKDAVRADLAGRRGQDEAAPSPSPINNKYNIRPTL